MPRETVSVRWKGVLGASDSLGMWSPDGEVGCALAGVRSAVAWGAPLAATADYPLHVYAPDRDIIRQARLLNEGGEGAEVRFSIDPVGYVSSVRFKGLDPPWWTAHPIFCALDLTSSARDREALASWQTPKGFARVW